MSYDFDAAERFSFAIEKACASMPLNQSVRLLESDPSAIDLLRNALSSMGQERFINLTNSSKQAMTAIALYSGDGIVTKIIPQGSLGRVTDVMFHLPAITTTLVRTEHNKFVIKTYPYVFPDGVTQSEVDGFGELIGQVGMEFNANDGMPKNVHKLPDNNRTLIGIDSDMYHYGVRGSLIKDDMRSAWYKFIYDLFPIYEHRQIPEQSESTSFDFFTIHDPQKAGHSFDLSSYLKSGKPTKTAQGGGASGNQDIDPDMPFFGTL